MAVKPTFRLLRICVCIYLLPILTMGFWLPIVNAQENIDATIENRLKSILTLAKKDIDLAETVLLISKHRDPALDLTPLRRELDRLTDKVRTKLNKVSSPQKIVDAFRVTIHDEEGYLYTDRVDAQGIPIDSAELFLHGMLKSKRGYCMNLSLLYLIIADRLDIPLFGVPLPNHFFVRYKADSTSINIEATDHGYTIPDSYYQKRANLPEQKKSDFFMSNIGKRATLGSYFSNVGMVYYKAGQAEKAVFYLDLSTKINTGSIEAHNNLANIYSETGQIEKAILHYQLALKADPGSLSTLYNLGLAHRQSGHTNKAIEAFLQVVQIDTSYGPGHQALVKLFLAKRQYFGALLHLNKLAQIDPRNFHTQIAIGRIYLRMGQPPLALQTFKRLRTQYPDKVDVLQPLAETFYRMEDFDRAIQLYRYLIEHHPNLLRAYIQLGWTHYRKGEIKLASAWTKRGLKTATGEQKLVVLAQMNLGFYALLGQSFPEARQWYRKVLNNKDSGVAVDMVKDIQDATLKFPNRPDLEFFSGWILFESGQIENAKPFLRNYLKQNPSGEFAQEARSLIAGLTFKKAVAEEKETPKNMARVPSGLFTMGSNLHGLDETPEHQVFLDAFFIDIHEVTAKDYAEFLNTVKNPKTYYLDNKFGTLFYNGRFLIRSGLGSLPINNVSWNGADAYCRSIGKRLPTEAEWEKAARGTDKRIFPWGNSPPTPKRARYFQTWMEETAHRIMVPVSDLPEGKSPFGLHNMAGNVKEWVDDWYDREYYTDSSEYENPRGPIGGEFKVLRGGSWRDLSGFVYSSFRNNSDQNTRMDDYGFRCAQSIDAENSRKKLTRWKNKFFDQNGHFHNISQNGL
jgi:formylglycine-generating enzyme required for sulfatase activity/regulator of sirC expression with transglutaminase-like and TPR domain